jgi:DNA-binding NtrC family response regulator
MLTGNPSLEVAIQAINDGAISRFYTKPCHELDLLITVRHALQQKVLAQEAMRLLLEYRKQKARLEKIEAHFPGASGIPDDVVTYDVKDIGSLSYDDFIEELRKSFGD